MVLYAACRTTRAVAKLDVALQDRRAVMEPVALPVKDAKQINVLAYLVVVRKFYCDCDGKKIMLFFNMQI